MISTILIITFCSFASAFGQLKYLVNSIHLQMKNTEYNLNILLNGKSFERVPGDYVTAMVVFAPSSEVNFKEYDS